MSNPITYEQFFKNFVLRKKQELVDPRFMGIGEVILPKASLIHYLPKGLSDYGPSTHEAFISNFPNDVYIDFVQDMLLAVIGNGRVETFDVRKAIQGYRASHYQYNWTRDMTTVYAKVNNLVVKNYGLVPHRFVYRPSVFMNYEKYYNLQTLLMKGINEESLKGVRKQYLRIELPLNFPSFSELCEDYRKFILNFKDGKPVVTQQIIESTKAENSYWLLDMLAFWVGQYQFSLFNQLTQKSLEDLHVIFTFQSKALVVNMGLLKTWLDEAKSAEVKQYKTVGEEFDKIKSSPRMNAVKRLYLALMGLSRNFVPEKEITKEETVHENGRSPEAEDSNQNPAMAPGSEGQEGEGEGQGNTEVGNTAGKNAPARTGRGGGGILDVFASPEAADGRHDEVEGHAPAGSSDAGPAEWTSAVDDSLLEVEKVESEINSSKDPFPFPESGIKAALDARARDGVLTVAEQEFFMRKGSRYKHIEMPNGQTFEEYIKIDPSEIANLDGKIEGNFLTVLDESMLRSRAKALKVDYPQKFLDRDICRMVLAIQNAGYCMNDFKKENVTSIEGSYDVYNIQLHEVNGDQVTIHPRIPKVLPDGNFMIDGVKNHMQHQRREKPLRKISPEKVALTSYYDRKLMISRSAKMVDNLSTWMVKQIALQSKARGYTFSKGSGFSRHYVSPRIYSMLAKQYKYIKVGDTTLDFQIEDLLAKHPEFKQYTKKERFLIGVKGNQPLTIDPYGNLYQGETETGTIEDLLGIDLKKAPLEHAVINISGYPFPLGVVLCYYFGIDKLLKTIKATTRTVPIGTRPKLASDEYAIQFNDEYLIFNRREKLTTLIFGGMPRLNNIGNFSRSDLNNNAIWPALMGDPKVRPSQFQEMKNLFDLFIDPITKEELQKMHLSDSFHYLLIDAAKALDNDYARHEVEIEEQRVVGYERFAGHMYTEFCRANRQYRNKGKGRKHKLDFNPDAVLQNIGKDTSVNQVEEVNPIHQLKDQEEVTFGGDGGRSEITMVKRARTQLESYKGVISDANKDSGKVGFVTYLTSDPGIADFRGNIDPKNKRTATGDGSVTMNLMYGGTHDDPKRVSFTSTQASQAVTAQNYQINTLRTGYENVVAHRTSELYSKVAKDEGKVTAVEDDCLTITYKDGTEDKYPLGMVVGEAAGEYHRHTRVTDLKVGDKFRKGDVVGWDDDWFARDVFCPGQVALKVGKICRIAMVEDQDVYEDSIAISMELAQEFRTPFIKQARFPVNVEHVLDLKVKVGDTVERDAILCNLEEPHLVEGEAQDGFREELNKYGIKQIRSKHHGKITAIEVRYNSPLEKMSDSVRKFVLAKNKETKRKGSIENSGVVDNAISTLSNVNRPSIAPGMAYVMIYIESLDASTNADKYVLGNQMKATVGRIMGKPMTTKSGWVIDIKASFKGMFNRMVLSFRNKLVTNELTYQFTQQAIKAYRGK